MVQKKGAAAKGKTPVKAKQIKPVKEEIVEEVEQIVTNAKGKRAAAAKPVSKKAPVKIVPPAPMEIEDDDEDESTDEELENGRAESASDDDDDNDEEDEEDSDETIDSEEEPGEVSLGSDTTAATNNDDGDSDDDDDDDEDDDEEEEEDEEDDDDEAPEETAIEKAPKEEATTAEPATKIIPKKGGIPKITTGNISPKTPTEQIIRVENLPEKFQQIEIIEAFAKYGTIQTIGRVKVQGTNRSVFIAFTTAEGAKAAIEAAEIKIKENVLQISKLEKVDGKERDTRTVVISCLGPVCTPEQLKSHFEKCGTIEETTLSKNRNCPYGFVRFQTEESVAEALKLNNSILNDRILSVRSKSKTAEKNAERTIVVSNTQEVESYSSDALQKIFKNCGEIADVEILCTKSTLAFVTFQTEEGAQKAFDLNGQTFGDLELKLSRYQASSNRTIVVTNLAFGITEEELSEVFAKAGELEHVKVCGTFALVKFKTNDGFCKSFLLNETYINGRPVFLEPNSTLKQKWTTRHHSHYQNNFQGRRPGPQNNGFNNRRFGGGPHQHGNGGQFNGNKNFNNKRPGGPGGKKPFNNNKRPGGKRPHETEGTVPHFYKKTKSD